MTSKGLIFDDEMGKRIKLTLVKKESLPVSKRRSFTFTWLL